MLKALSDTKEDSTRKLEDVLERFVRAAQTKGTLTDAPEDPVTDVLKNPATDVPKAIPLDAIAPAQSIASPVLPMTARGW